MKIEFGIMSQRYSLESIDIIHAKLAMCLFYKQNIPIAIYIPKTEAFLPMTFLQSNPKVINEEIKKAYDSIKEVKQ